MEIFSQTAELDLVLADRLEILKKFAEFIRYFSPNLKDFSPSRPRSSSGKLAASPSRKTQIRQYIF